MASHTKSVTSPVLLKMLTRSFESYTVVGSISAIFGRSFAPGTNSGPQFFRGGFSCQKKGAGKIGGFLSFIQNPRTVGFKRDEDGILCLMDMFQNKNPIGKE